MKMARNRNRKFTLKDGTTVEYSRYGDVKSRVVTSPCGATCSNIQLTRAITRKAIRGNLYEDMIDGRPAVWSGLLKS